MSISGIFPPTKHDIKAITPEGKVVVCHGVQEINVRFSGLVQANASAMNKQKKVSKEVAKQNKKQGQLENFVEETTMAVERTNSTIGASPADDFTSYFTYEDPKTYWRKKEWNQFNDFVALKRKYDETYIPSEKARYLNTLLRIHGTLDEKKRETSLTVEMLADPRLDIKTNRGVIKTTVATQAQFAKERLGLSGVNNET